MSLLTIVLALPALAPASPPPAAVALVEDEPSYEALAAEFDEAYSAWYERYRGAKTQEEQQKVARENPAPGFVPRFFALAEAKPGTGEAFDALSWLVQNAAPVDRDRSLAALERDFVEDRRLKRIVQRLRDPSAGTEAFLRVVAEKSPHAQVRGWATYGLAQQLTQQQSMADALRQMPEAQQDAYRNYFGAETIDGMLDRDAAAYASEIERLLSTVVSEYGDEDGLAETAKNDLFEIQNLAIGKIAPDIEGEDLDGVEFKLSDYRGKVVVLDFWGNW